MGPTEHQPPPAAPAPDVQLLRATGRSGHATIVAVRETGTPVGDLAQVELELLVSADGLAPYPARVRQPVRRGALPRLCAGALVPVRIDPVDQQRLIVA